jgi:hypothetical protein
MRLAALTLWEIEGSTPVKQVLGEKRILAGNA